MKAVISILSLLVAVSYSLPITDASDLSRRDAQSSNAEQFNGMLAQYNELQEQTMIENMEMQQAQAFWNPLESASKQDATS